MTEVIAYHDETHCENSNCLYQGFILVPQNKKEQFRDMLAQRRRETGCTKRVHFSKMRRAEGSRFKLASLWANDHKMRHLGLGIRFFLLGIDLPKVTFKFRSTGPLPKDIVIYNWSWRVALTGALSFLFERHEKVRLVKVYREFSDLKPSDKSLTTALRKICTEGRNFVLATGACLMIHPEESDEMQLVDVLAGAHRQNIEGSSNAPACKAIAKQVSEVTHRLITNPYNKNSRFYKRYCISFYPKESIAELGDGSIMTARDFYHNRPLKGCMSNQQSFDL